MAKRNEVHTMYNAKDKNWYNIVAVPETYTSKKEAKAAGRELAQGRKAEHFVHNRDGKIAERNSYGGDSPDRPGVSKK